MTLPTTSQRLAVEAAGRGVEAGGDVFVVEEVGGVERELQVLALVVDGGVDHDVVGNLEGVRVVAESLADIAQAGADADAGEAPALQRVVRPERGAVTRDAVGRVALDAVIALGDLRIGVGVGGDQIEAGAKARHALHLDAARADLAGLLLELIVLGVGA